MTENSSLPVLDLGSLASVGNLSKVMERTRFHAYIIYGDRGSRRHETAERLAAAFLCEDREKVPCEVCPSCKKVRTGNHPDLIRLDGDGLSVDTMRAALEQLLYVPTEGVCRVYLIDNADALSVLVQNVMLKSLEEPPENTVFLLIGNALESLLPTVRSRCVTIRTGYAGEDADAEKTNSRAFVRAFLEKDRRGMLIAFNAAEKEAGANEKRDKFEAFLRECSGLLAAETEKALQSGRQEDASRAVGAKEITDGILLKLNAMYGNLNLWGTYYVTRLCLVP